MNSDIGDALSQASLVALVSMFMGIVPLGMGVVYAIWPSVVPLIAAKMAASDRGRISASRCSLGQMA